MKTERQRGQQRDRQTEIETGRDRERWWARGGHWRQGRGGGGGGGDLTSECCASLHDGDVKGQGQ